MFYLSGLPHEVRVESACTFAHVSAVTCFLQVDVARLKKKKQLTVTEKKLQAHSFQYKSDLGLNRADSD